MTSAAMKFTTVFSTLDEEVPCLIPSVINSEIELYQIG